MDETERVNVPPLDETGRRWLQGRLNGHERQLGDLRYRIEQLERALLELRANQRTRAPRRRAATVTGGGDEHTGPDRG